MALQASSCVSQHTLIIKSWRKALGHCAAPSSLPKHDPAHSQQQLSPCPDSSTHLLPISRSKNTDINAWRGAVAPDPRAAPARKFLNFCLRCEARAPPMAFPPVAQHAHFECYVSSPANIRTLSAAFQVGSFLSQWGSRTSVLTVKYVAGPREARQGRCN